MRADRLPLTYDECRARFRWAAHAAEVTWEGHPIDAPGPDGQILTVEVAALGATRPQRALLVLSGTHGVEGPIGSALQCDLLASLDPASLPAEVAVVLVHAVNPWGMAWWRRQNESNVDLNRNWARDRIDPPGNENYAALHDLLCPDDDELPDAREFLDGVAPFVERHGVAWVRDAVSNGQYSHPDGLYFGGDRTEASTTILEQVVGERLAGVESSLSVDLHTGHGEYGTHTILSDQPPGSDDDRWLHRHFGDVAIEATVDNPQATTGTKVGQLGHGFADVLPGSVHRSVTLEFGAASDTRQIIAGRAEHWVHRHGDRRQHRHADAVRTHRDCYTPDDASWERGALAQGRAVLDAALVAVASPSPGIALREDREERDG